MLKKIILFIMCCVGAGCNKPAAVSSSEDFNALCAVHINDRATGAAVYKGNLYVYGSFKGFLKKIDLSTGAVTELPCEYVAAPHGLTVQNDNIWITDTENHQVYKLDLNGRLLASYGEKGIAGCDKKHFKAPTDVAVSKNGNIYVTDGYGNRRVVCMDSEGNYLFDWGSEGSSQGQFVNPHDIIIENDKVYVADRENSRVQIFSLDGKYLDQWRMDGKVFGLWYANNKMYMSIQAKDTDYIAVCDMSGKILDKRGSRGKAAGQFDVPHSLSCDNNYIYVAEVNNKRLQRIDLF